MELAGEDSLPFIIHPTFVCSLFVMDLLVSKHVRRVVSGSGPCRPQIPLEWRVSKRDVVARFLPKT